MTVVLLALLACGDRTPQQDPGLEPPPRLVAPDVVLVTLDTTRADRIGCYGDKDAVTPNIDALCNAGERYDWAFSPIPLTIPAHSTLMTGLLPYHHGIRSNGDGVLDAKFTTLAERLHDKGYMTAASVAAFVTTRQWGFSQGFDAYYDTLPASEGPGNYWHMERPGSDVVDDALSWLGGVPTNQPVFLWVHLYDAHYPYEPHPETGVPAERPYDGEIAYLDQQVGRLREAMKGRDVLWVLVGDHGESLGEHGEPTHGTYAYEATQHVPFIVSGYGRQPQVVTTAVSTADVTPTILKDAGFEVPDGLDGQPQPGAEDVPYAESWQLTERFGIAPHRAVFGDKYELIATPKPELYDYRADPKQTNNLAETNPDVVERLKKLLDAKNAGAPVEQGGASIDADAVSQLAALGYVSGGSALPADLDITKLPDPKDWKQWLEDVLKLDNQGGRDPATQLAEIQRLSKQRPEAFELWMQQLPLLERTGKGKDAKKLAQDLAKKFPDQSRVWVTLTGMAVRSGDTKSAVDYAQKGIEIAPKDSAAQEAWVGALFVAGRADDAVKAGEEYMKDNPDNYGVAAELGQHYLQIGDYKNAELNLRVAVAGPNPRRGSRVQLARLAMGANARQDAYKLLEDEIKDYPGNIMARRALSAMLADDHRWDEQKTQAEFVAKALPKDATAQLALAQCEFNLADYKGARETLNHAMEMAPENPDVLLLHANLLAKEGKRDEGYQVFQKAQAMKQALIEEGAPTGDADADAATKDGKDGAAGKDGKAKDGQAPKDATKDGKAPKDPPKDEKKTP